jgi:hypothetical protein
LPSEHERLHGIGGRGLAVGGDAQLAAQGVDFLLQSLIVNAAAIQLFAQLADIVLAGTQFAFHAIATAAPAGHED